MLDELLDIFERDKKKTSGKPAGGLRGRLSSMLDGDRDDDRRSSERRYDDRDRTRDDDDRDDDDRSTKRKKKRELEFLDFGD
jgi:hypothetical protein